VLTAHVQAESLCEAVALAASEFRRDPMAQQFGPMTEFVVAVETPTVEHRIQLSKVHKWTEATTREGPAGIMKRQKLRTLLWL
jgi:hypothetical protein